MRARVVAQLFYKHASIILSYASTELDFLNMNNGLPKMFGTVRVSEVTEVVSFTQLVEFSRVVFFGSTRFFRITRTSQVTEGDYSICRISRISKYLLLEGCSIWRRISEDILSMLWQCSSRISGDRVFNNVPFSRNNRRCSFCRTRRISKD